MSTCLPYRAAVAIAAILCASGLAACSDSGDSGSANSDYQIGLSQIVADQMLDQVQQGIVDRLKEIGTERDVTFDVAVENAQGEVPNGQVIAQQFVQDDKDLIVGIGTPVVIAAAQVTSSVPIVFGGMTDPVGGGIAESLKAPGGNATGTTDFVEPARNLEVIQKVDPSIQTVGTIINESESNSVAWLDAFETAAESAGLDTEVVSVGGSGDVQGAAESLRGRVDAILIGADNTALAATAAIAKTGLDAKIPVFSVSATATENGALIGMGVDNYEIGQKTADIVARILLDGEEPGEIPVEGLEELQVAVNEETATTIGVEVPDEVAGDLTESP